MSTPMKRTHQVLVTVTFNKPCSAAEARAAFKDNVYGEFFPDVPREVGTGPDLMKVRGVKPVPKAARK